VKICDCSTPGIVKKSFRFNKKKESIIFKGGEEKVKKESSLSKLFVYAGKFRYLTIASWILSVISAWLALVPWRIMKEVLSVAPDFGKAAHLKEYGWAAVGFAILSMLVYVCALMCSHLAAFRVQANIRTSLMRHILTLPMGFLDKDGTGKIRKIVNESSAATETYLAHQLPDQAGAIATPAGLLVLLMVFDFRLGLLSLIPVVAAFLIMGTMTGQRMKDKMEEYQNALDEMSSEAVEYVRGIPVVKTFGQSVFSFKRFQTSIQKYEKWTIAYTKEMRIPMTVYTTAINAVFAVLIAATFFFTGKGGDNTFLLNLLFYIIITPIITVTMNKIMYSSENQLIVADAISRIESILEKKPLPETAHAQEPENNSITFENVSFRYEDGGRDALHQINLTIKEGEHVAFVGPSGGGKTTLTSLVARFFDTTEGRILIGNKDVKEISSKQLMDMVSFVFQDSKLLKTSILENVRMGKKDATREEVMQALKEAQCEDIIAKLPDGIDTVIGSSGTYVSGGEAQRLSIARAMLKNAPILILDEATAFADPDNEAKVQEAFSRLSKGKTVIMIAHRLSSIVDADRICVLKDGSIAEEGTHETLLQKNGVYAHMWEEYNKSVQWKVGA
jgi:ATP-binding cassette subfamily B protein IrtA